MIKRWSLDALLRGDTRPMALAASVGLGAFIGLSPAYGFHTVIVLGLVALFRLNPVAALLGSQISFGPLIVPLMAGEVMIGDLLRFGHVVQLPKLGAGALARWLLSNALPSWMLGWVVMGGAAAILTGLATLGFLSLRTRARPPSGNG
jgi:uncharacterized protein (DUF2062 family)